MVIDRQWKDNWQRRRHLNNGNTTITNNIIEAILPIAQRWRRHLQSQSVNDR
jgi:hypothetical protein